MIICLYNAFDHISTIPLCLLFQHQIVTTEERLFIHFRQQRQVSISTTKLLQMAQPARPVKGAAKPWLKGQADDLASLPNLDETVLLEELKTRYTEDKIYVCCL